MKPWFYNEQSITEFKEPVVYKGLNISVSKTKVKPPYIAVVTSPATGKEIARTGGDTEQAALDSAKQAVDKREADAPKISAGGQTSILFNTPSNDELLKDPSMYNTVYAKISKDKNGPTLVIGNEVYGAADLEASGFVGSYDRRTKRGRDSEETLPQVMFNANNKLLSQIGIKMNGRYTLDTAGKYRDEDEHTVYPLQFQGSTVHAGDRLRMNRPALTIGATREDIQPWFQRELEEAEVIKFPEPENKVLDMPSVASYPDFITGVADLKARRHKGDISQASHDKLYTDLIHRFMRKESFETPWFLREQDEGGVGQAAKDLIATANASDDPEYEKETQNLLVKAKDFLKKILGKPQTENVAPQVEAIPNELAGLMQLAKEKFSPEQFNDVQNQLIQSFGRKQREAFDQGKVAQKTQTANVRKEIQDLISIMISKFSPSEAKSKQRLEQIRSFFTTQGISDDDTIEFLQLANQGQVINMQALIAAGEGNIRDHVNPAARAVYDKVSRSFMELQPEKSTGRGSVGSGEVFFITLGRPAIKSAKGDLTVPVGGKETKIEVKASRFTFKKDGTKSMSGGRFSGDAMASPPDIQKQFSALLKKYFKVSGFNDNKKFVYNITQKTLKALNEIIVDKKISRENVVAFTSQMLNLFHTNLSGKTEAIAKKMVNADSTIDTNAAVKLDDQGKKIQDNKFYRGIAYANYMSYQKSNKFDAILSFNMDGQSYEFIGSGNDLAKKISSGQIVPFGGIDFNDSQNKAALQVFTR